MNAVPLAGPGGRLLRARGGGAFPITSASLRGAVVRMRRVLEGSMRTWHDAPGMPQAHS